MASAVIIYTLQDKGVFEPLYIDLQDIDSEWLSFSSLRVIVEVLNKNDFDCEIDVRFEVDQVGEATQVLTKTFIIEAHFKQELYTDFNGVDSTKASATRAEIISQ